MRIGFEPRRTNTGGHGMSEAIAKVQERKRDIDVTGLDITFLPPLEDRTGEITSSRAEPVLHLEIPPFKPEGTEASYSARNMSCLLTGLIQADLPEDVRRARDWRTLVRATP